MPKNLGNDDHVDDDDDDDNDDDDDDDDGDINGKANNVDIVSLLCLLRPVLVIWSYCCCCCRYRSWWCNCYYDWSCY